MKIRQIDSIKDPAFEELRRNRTLTGRQQHHTFAIENEEMILQALQEGFALKALFSVSPLSQQIINLTKKQKEPPILYLISQGMMGKAFSSETPEIVALAFKKESKPGSLLGKSLLLILDQIQNCNNIGMIFRSTEAFGVEGVIIVPHPKADLYDRNVIKGSMGSFFRLLLCQMSVEEALSFSKSHKIQLITTVVGSPIFLEAMPVKFPAALVVGNESLGICPAFMEGSDTQISIPMKGKIQSLNVVVAASVCLYHLSKISENPYTH